MAGSSLNVLLLLSLFVPSISANCAYSRIKFNTFKETCKNISIYTLDYSRVYTVESLVFENSYISSVPAGIFNKYHKLSSLRLDGNNLRTLELNCFDGLRTLTDLQLQRNNIAEIPLGTFKDLRNLKSLNLSHNDISSFQFGTFSGLKKLEVLDISLNELTRINLDHLFPLEKLTMLNVVDNPYGYLDSFQLGIYFKHLKTVGMNCYDLECSSLTQLMNQFRSNGIEILPGKSFNVTNVNGFYCLTTYN